ncbi:MAG: hypothetical protein DA328_09745 [Nitrososphaeraceae archaeon]|nr:hypothetical protein [Nitrososphaeraceae archaeon]
MSLEESFRENYKIQLRMKKQNALVDELNQELVSVRQQSMKTPGRRGEEIKFEEIFKEMGRRREEHS